jgi:hypothetical protein
MNKKRIILFWLNFLEQSGRFKVLHYQPFDKYVSCNLVAFESKFFYINQNYAIFYRLLLFIIHFYFVFNVHLTFFIENL